MTPTTWHRMVAQHMSRATPPREAQSHWGEVVTLVVVLLVVFALGGMAL